MDDLLAVLTAAERSAARAEAAHGSKYTRAAWTTIYLARYDLLTQLRADETVEREPDWTEVAKLDRARRRSAKRRTARRRSR